MIKKFDFDDINLIPQKCIVDSRSECDTTVTLGKHTFKIPVVPANMSAVIDPNVAERLAQNGFFYIMHRFNIDPIVFVSEFKARNLVTSISIGVNDADYKMIGELSARNLCPNFITVDIAHGHSTKMERMLAFIKNNLPDAFIIAGNVSTREAATALADWGADAVKVGIAPGHACTTAFATGFGSRNCQASTIHDIAQYCKVPVIADGGIKHPSDIVKSIVMGATMVMCGNLMSGCSDSPGELKTINGEQFKEYWGSASDRQDGKSNRIEGTTKLIPYKNKTVLQQMIYLKECLQSAISYGGGKNLQSLAYVRWH